MSEKEKQAFQQHKGYLVIKVTLNMLKTDYLSLGASPDIASLAKYPHLVKNK